jgi:hypothetical protein
MNLTRDRMHTIGWGMTLVICFALTLVLTFRVNAVKSQVRLADRHIAALRQEKIFLETEFQARASQQQLKAFNDVDFGYSAPTAGQYLENERQLAALGKPRSPDAPTPIRVASADGLKSTVRLMPVVVSDGSDKAEAKPSKSRDISAHLAALGRKEGAR